MPEQQPIQPPPQTNGKAITALVLGILAVVVPYIGLILGIIAIVFARKSMNEMSVTDGGGRGMAIAGLVCGIVGVCLYGLILLVIFIGFITFSLS